MNKLKEFFQKNNYLASKVAGAILAAGIVIALIILLATGDNEAGSGNDGRGNSTMEKTVDVAENHSTEGKSTENDDTSDMQGAESSEETTTLTTEQSTSDEESISTSEVASENDDTTTTQRQESTETETQEQKTSKIVTTQSTTTPAPTTQKTTTTRPPETTTEEETTTAPPRGANGVILEELVLNRVSGVEPLPKSFAEIVASGTSSTVSKNISYLSVPDVLNPNVFGNEILVYNKVDCTGSVEKDVTDIYGEPLYRYVRSDTGGVRLIYKYLPFGQNNEQDLYMRFAFEKDKEYKLIGITLTSFEQLQTDGEFKP